MAYSLVQSKAGTSSTTATATVTFTSNVTAGNRVLAYTDYYHSAATDLVSLTDSLSNTWTKLVSASFAPTGGADTIFMDLWTAVVAATGAMTITATGVTANEIGVTAQEFSGLDSSAGSGSLDVSATGAGVNGTGNPTSGTTAATHAANQLAVSAIGDWGANVTWTVSAGGFTKDAGASRDNDATAGQGVAYKTSANGATEVCTWTNGAVADASVALVAVIKLAAVAAAIPSKLEYLQAVNRAETY